MLCCVNPPGTLVTLQRLREDRNLLKSHTAAEKLQPGPVRSRGPQPASLLPLRCFVAFGKSRRQPESGPKEEEGSQLLSVYFITLEVYGQ